MQVEAFTVYPGNTLALIHDLNISVVSVNVPSEGDERTGTLLFTCVNLHDVILHGCHHFLEVKILVESVECVLFREYLYFSFKLGNILSEGVSEFLVECGVGIFSSNY